jgi:Domain of unknown function (DUF1707)
MARSRQPRYALRASFWGEVPVMAGPGDEITAGQAGRGHLRASHADREQVINTVKAAFVQGMLTKAELDVRLGQTFAARTCGELAALTADLPAGLAAAGPAPARPARRRPLAKAGAGSGGCLVIAAAAVRAIDLADPGPTPGVIPKYWGTLFVLIALAAVVAALGILKIGVAASLEQRRSRRQLPPRPGPHGHAPGGERHGGPGHGPAPPAPRTGQNRADLQAHKPRQHRQRIPARAARAPRGTRPAPGTA